MMSHRHRLSRESKESRDSRDFRESRNRLQAILLHVPHYTIGGGVRLAADCHVAKSTISRLLRGHSCPSYELAQKIVAAIALRSGTLLDPTEIFRIRAEDFYPTCSVCELMGCEGCFPPEAWSETTDTLRPRWRKEIPGDWSRDQQSLAAGTSTLAPSA